MNDNEWKIILEIFWHEIFQYLNFFQRLHIFLCKGKLQHCSTFYNQILDVEINANNKM